MSTKIPNQFEEILEEVDDESLFSAQYCIEHGAIEDLRRTKEYKNASSTLQISMELEAAHVRLAHEIETYNEHIKAFRNNEAQEQLKIVKLVRMGISTLHEKRTRHNMNREEDLKKKR